MNKPFVLLVGGSGSGKTTLATELESRGYKMLPSYTTRQPRTPDERGHTFITKQKVFKLKELVAFTMFDSHIYCATEEQVEENDVFVVDPRGVRFFRMSYQGGKQPVVVYLKVPLLTRFVRLLKRGDGLKKALRRIWHDRKAFIGFEGCADLVLENETTGVAAYLVESFLAHWKAVRD